MKKDHMQKVKQKVPKDKSHLDPGQSKLLEIALIFWRYDSSQWFIFKPYPRFHLHSITLQFDPIIRTFHYFTSTQYGAFNPISQKQFERGDFHVTWCAFVLPNSHFRTNSLSLIFSSKSWSRASFFLFHSFKLFDVLPNSQIRTDFGSNLWIW